MARRPRAAALTSARSSSDPTWTAMAPVAATMSMMAAQRPEAKLMATPPRMRAKVRAAMALPTVRYVSGGTQVVDDIGSA